MEESNGHRILFVPGMRPKPPAEEHRDLLWGCLSEGVRRADPRVVLDKACFEVIAWNPLYYDTHRDIELDRPWVEQMLERPGPDDRDRAESGSLRWRFYWALFTLLDRFPGLVKYVRQKWILEGAAETRRYFENTEGIADAIREPLAERIVEEHHAGNRVLLIGHSLGSVIAFDTLWELSRASGSEASVDLFLTLGSPLGLRFIKKRLRGAGQKGAERYPSNIRRWVNIASVGELKALDPSLRDDFAEMTRYGLVHEVTDLSADFFNYYREQGRLNVHKSYGYLLNPITGRVIADWWRHN
ncbi:MAG: hypothetical protein V3U59_02635 [Gammaproteobacteria bacterium]